MEQDFPHKLKTKLIICVLLTVKAFFKIISELVMLLIFWLSSQIFLVLFKVFGLFLCPGCIVLLVPIQWGTKLYVFFHAAKFRLIVVQWLTLFYSLFFSGALCIYFFSTFRNWRGKKFDTKQMKIVLISSNAQQVFSMNTVTVGKIHIRLYFKTKQHYKIYNLQPMSIFTDLNM